MENVKNCLVLVEPSSPRSRMLGESMERGLLHLGFSVKVERSWNGRFYDLVSGYGWGPSIREACLSHRAEGKDYIHIDLGYWGRRPKHDTLRGYHKVVLNGLHPLIRPEPKEWLPDNPRLEPHFESREIVLKTARPRPPDSRPWRVLVAGMSAKCARSYGHEPEQWENNIIRHLIRQGCEVIYRPKPSWADARPLARAGYSPPAEPLEEAFARVDAICTHHSNIAVHGLCSGFPVWVAAGPLRPFMPAIGFWPPRDGIEHRRHILHSLIAAQWCAAEIEIGAFWESTLAASPRQIVDGKRGW